MMRSIGSAARAAALGAAAAWLCSLPDPSTLPSPMAAQVCMRLAKSIFVFCANVHQCGAGPRQQTLRRGH